MTTIEHLQSALSGLGLKAIEARLENLLEQASKTEPSYADFLSDLLGCEVDARRSRYLRARLQLAHQSTHASLIFSNRGRIYTDGRSLPTEAVKGQAPHLGRFSNSDRRVQV
jgi:DNA replication protein DnaC